MPNHVKNKLTFEGKKKDIEALLDFIKNDEGGLIDFNKIIPMPPELNIESSSEADKGLRVYKDYLLARKSTNVTEIFDYPDKHEDSVIQHLRKIKKFKKDNKETWDLGVKAYNNLKKYGHTDWYSWCSKEWGTKWNAYSIASGFAFIEFETAWSPPTPVINKLARMFPFIRITHEWADEDLGRNCGKCDYEGVYGYVEEPDIYSREAYEFAAKVWGLSLEEEGYTLSANGKTYEWSDEGE